MVRLWSNFDTALMNIFDKSKALVQHCVSKDDKNARKFFKQTILSDDEKNIECKCMETHITFYFAKLF